MRSSSESSFRSRPRSLATVAAPVSRCVVEKRELARRTGLWAAHLPEAHGGAGLALTEFAHMSEELGRTPIGHYAFNCQAPDVGNMEILMELGTPEQKEKFLCPLARVRDVRRVASR